MADGNQGTQGRRHHWDAVFENDDSPAQTRKPAPPSDRQPPNNRPPPGRAAPGPPPLGQPAPDPVAALAQDAQRTGERLTQLVTQFSAFEQRQQEVQERLLRTIEARLDARVAELGRATAASVADLSASVASAEAERARRETDTPRLPELPRSVLALPRGVDELSQELSELKRGLAGMAEAVEGLRGRDAETAVSRLDERLGSVLRKLTDQEARHDELRDQMQELAAAVAERSDRATAAWLAELSASVEAALARRAKEAPRPPELLGAVLGELAELRQQVEQLVAELRAALGRISDQMLEQSRGHEERLSQPAGTVQAKGSADLPPPLKRLPDVVAALAHQLAEHQQGQKSREAKLADAVSALRQEVAKAAEAAGRRLPNQLLRLPMDVAELGERHKSDQSELAEALLGLRQEIDRYGQSTLALSEALAGLSRRVEDGQEEQQRRVTALSVAVDGLKAIGDLPAWLTGFAERQMRALAALEAAVKRLDADAKQLEVTANRPVQLPEPVLSLPDAVTALAVHAAEQRQRQDEQGAGLAALTEAVRRLHDEVGDVFQAVDTARVGPEPVLDIQATVSALAAQLGEQRQGLRKLVEHLIQQEAQQDRMVEYLSGFRNGIIRLAEAVERKESSTNTGIEAATERLTSDLGDLRRELAGINERLVHLSADGGTRPTATRASRAGSVGKEERTPQAS